MKLLITGRGTSGSWKIRGEQLGAELGAVVKPRAVYEDMSEADLVVVVKRPGPGMIDELKRSRTPWVWDVVDFYPQPACTKWTRHEAISWTKKQIDAFAPSAIVWPNRRMAEDCDVSIPGFVLYHHSRPDITPAPLRDGVKVVGYEGGPYLGRWEKALKRECLERGWEWRNNPDTYADLDIVVAFRDQPFDGYVQRNWKSNVKLANAHAAGIPFIGSPESGYVETATGHEIFCDSIDEISSAFSALTNVKVRQRIRESFLPNAISLSSVAESYANCLRAVI